VGRARERRAQPVEHDRRVVARAETGGEPVAAATSAADVHSAPRHAPRSTTVAVRCIAGAISMRMSLSTVRPGSGSREGVAPASGASSGERGGSGSGSGRRSAAFQASARAAASVMSLGLSHLAGDAVTR